jgi:ornithine cyclodeaminase/alanine dehydrogenase-like protein (mu-crystallin family)
MVLLLRNHDLAGLMPFAGYIEAVEEGYRQLGLGKAISFPRQNLWIEGDPAEVVGNEHLPPYARGAFIFKAAMLPGPGYAGVQPYTVGLPGGLQSYLLLFSTQTGDLVALMEVLQYGLWKTAAVAAVATKYLAPPECTVAAIFGTGRHARTQLHALCAVRPITRIQVYSRTRADREAFCKRMTTELGLDVIPAESPEHALKEAEVVTTFTTSPSPVFDGAWLSDRPLHINAMGAHYPWVREIEDSVVLSSKIYLDHWEQGLQEHGEVLIPIEQGLMLPNHIEGDLGQLITGQIEGRTPDTRWTLFLSGGTGIEDIAVASRLYDLARQKGVGIEWEA